MCLLFNLNEKSVLTSDFRYGFIQNSDDITYFLCFLWVDSIVRFPAVVSATSASHNHHTQSRGREKVWQKLIKIFKSPWLKMNRLVVLTGLAWLWAPALEPRGRGKPCRLRGKAEWAQNKIVVGSTWIRWDKSNPEPLVDCIHFWLSDDSLLSFLVISLIRTVILCGICVILA